MKRLTTILFLFGSMLPQTSLADERMRIADYLERVKAAPRPKLVTPLDRDPWIDSLEVRTTIKEDVVDEVNLRVMPFAWGERDKLKGLSDVEKSLLSASLESNSKSSIYELWVEILALRVAYREKNSLENTIKISDRLIQSLQGNSEELVARPDSYIEALSGHQELNYNLREARAQIESLEASLGALIGANKVSFDHGELISPHKMREELVASFLTVGQTADPVKTLLAQRAGMEIELETMREDKLLNYFTLGTSFKPDGQSRAIELGFGIEIPVGRYPATMLELHRKKIIAESDADGARLNNQREIKRLTTKIIDRLTQIDSKEVRTAEEKMDKIHEAIIKTYGSGSLVALKSRFALEKYRLKKLESEASLYEDYLELNLLTGKLSDNGQPLVQAR